MGSLPLVLLLCSFHALTPAARAQHIESSEAPIGALPADCREELYPCTRMYSVHKPFRRCIATLCIYSMSRVYVINKEICTRTVCQQDEYLKAELCRELSGWPRRVERSSTGKRCRSRSRSRSRSRPGSWAEQP